MENREILSYFDILALSKCILYFDILLVFRICNLKFSRIRSQVRLRRQRGAFRRRRDAHDEPRRRGARAAGPGLKDE